MTSVDDDDDSHSSARPNAMVVADVDAIDREKDRAKRLTRLFGEDADADADASREDGRDATMEDDASRETKETTAATMEIARDARAEGEVEDDADDDAERSKEGTEDGEIESSDEEDEAVAGDESRSESSVETTERSERSQEGESSATDRTLSRVSTSTDKPERLRFAASLPQLYRYKDGEYVAVGAAGLAILDREGSRARDLLLYDVNKKPLIRRTIDHRLTCEPQRDNYVTVKFNGSILFSALAQDEGEWLAIAVEITIGQYIARSISAENFVEEAIVLDLNGPARGMTKLEMGDSARLHYEAVKGGGSSSFLEPDVLTFKLIDETSERVDGVKVKLESDSSAPSAVVQGIIGCSKDSRRLILAPKTETEFVLYDVTVTRIKKGGSTKTTSSVKPKAKPIAPVELTGHVETNPRGPDTRGGDKSTTTETPKTAPRVAPIADAQFAVPSTPPSPHWYGLPAQSLMMTLSPTESAAVLTEVRKLADDVSTLTVRARQGGSWIPPEPVGEMKHAIEALTRARRTVMLPAIDVRALSLSDVRQLTVEAERLDELHEELRELRKTKE